MAVQVGDPPYRLAATWWHVASHTRAATSPKPSSSEFSASEPHAEQALKPP
jgi:hypothetical protein